MQHRRQRREWQEMRLQTRAEVTFIFPQTFLLVWAPRDEVLCKRKRDSPRGAHGLVLENGGVRARQNLLRVV